MDQSRPTQSPVVELKVHKGLPAGTDAYARQKVSAVIRQAPEPVLSMRIRLTRHSNPAVARPVVAQATLDVNGRMVRAAVEASTANEAVDLVVAKLRRGLERIVPTQERHRHTPRSGAGERFADRKGGRPCD
jgi:ribosome-associated translation inhibitor RaiA